MEILAEAHLAQLRDRPTGEQVPAAALRPIGLSAPGAHLVADRVPLPVDWEDVYLVRRSE